jgi:predicted enzyme related to lactoylglutathione lyase
MGIRDAAWPTGVPCWVDLLAADIARARAFYAGLFGWSIRAEPPEANGYCIAEVDGRDVAGMGPKLDTADLPTAWTTYLATGDADMTAEKILAAGGQLLVEPFDVLGAGRMGMAADLDGAVFGLWEARAHTGAKLTGEPGTLAWSENMSRKLDGNKAFYQAVFGYTFDDAGTADLGYATLNLDGAVVGGIGELDGGHPADDPAHWAVYFGVADTDAAVARVAEMGGRVIGPARDSPCGRRAVVSDDQGAVFAVIAATPGGPG